MDITAFTTVDRQSIDCPAWIISLLLCGSLLCSTGCTTSESTVPPKAASGAAVELTTTTASSETAQPTPEVGLLNPFQGVGPWPLFNGDDLEGWEEADYAGKGEILVKDGTLYLGRGYMTGIRWTNDVVRMNYEVTYEAMRVDGTDFFCGFTFPVHDSSCTFIVGGWGGGVVGLSSINGMDAANNETTKYLNFENGKWFKMRVRVTPEKIETWIDDEPMVDQSILDQELSIRVEMEACVPIGFATWSTTGAIRNVVLKKI
jgi:hypothetical protein